MVCQVSQHPSHLQLYAGKWEYLFPKTSSGDVQTRPSWLDRGYHTGIFHLVMRHASCLLILAKAFPPHWSSASLRTIMVEAKAKHFQRMSSPAAGQVALQVHWPLLLKNLGRPPLSASLPANAKPFGSYVKKDSTVWPPSHESKQRRQQTRTGDRR